MRVSNELGVGWFKLVRFVVYVFFLMVGIEGILMVCMLILGYNYWGYLYSMDEEVVKYVGEMLFLFVCFYFFEGI